MRHLIILAALVTVSLACCLPKQYSVLLASGNFYKTSSTIQQSGMLTRLYYDFCNQRIRYLNPKTGYSFITDYGSKEYHSIRNGTCTTYKLHGSMARTCTPNFFHYMKTLNFGAGALPFDVVAYKKFGSTYSTGASYSIASVGCIPLIYSGYYKSSSYSSVFGTVWLNFTIGISDLSVFKAPPMCRSTKTLKSMENLDVWDIIAKDFSRETNSPEEVYNIMAHTPEQKAPERKMKVPIEKEEIKPESDDDFDGNKFLREKFGLGDFDFDDDDSE